MASVRLGITLDADWLALNMYRMALQKIVDNHAREPWNFSSEDAAELAEGVLAQFPSSNFFKADDGGAT